MMSASIASAIEATGAASREFSFFWGVAVPGLILACSVLFTWLLYRHFSKGEH